MQSAGLETEQYLEYSFICCLKTFQVFEGIELWYLVRILIIMICYKYDCTSLFTQLFHSSVENTNCILII